MSNLDMSEAVRMLAEHHGISVDALLQVLVEALATAYKKRPNAAPPLASLPLPPTMWVCAHRNMRRPAAGRQRLGR